MPFHSCKGEDKMGRLEAVFTENGAALLDVIPEKRITISVNYFNDDPRPTEVVITPRTDSLTRLNLGDSRNLKVAANLFGQLDITFITPERFGDIKINIISEEKSRIGFFREERHEVSLTIRMVTRAVTEVSRDPKVDDHLKEIKALGGTLILSPDHEYLIDVIPVVGDLSTTPTISLKIQTTSGVPIQLNEDEKGLNILQASIIKGQEELERVSEDQMILRYFADRYKSYLLDLGAEVQDTAGDIHLKVGPDPKLYYFLTQVIPSEDEGVLKKINNILTLAENEDADVTLIVTKLDEDLIALSQEKKVNVVNIFNGIIAKGNFTGDKVLEDFVEDVLTLKLVDINRSPDGAYTPNAFKRKMEEVK